MNATIGMVIAFDSYLYMNDIQVRNAAEMGVMITNCTAKISNSTIEKNNWGISATRGSSLEIQNSTITGNNIGMVITISECIIRYCNILGNKDFGILTVNSTVDARYNYWGSMFGPSYLFKFRGDLIWVFCDIKHFPWLLFPAN
ncbi:MAG TPA: right-handed parallel beta-helix repeat-containing protein [Thermoplasmatales archaeon]|nr:right-handed parallel beta-helix repeat-containing protein [Thermoplasmatales archaeon]